MYQTIVPYGNTVINALYGCSNL